MNNDFYTNVSIKGNKIRILGYSDDGKKIKKESWYKPYLFIKSDEKNSPYKTVYGEPVSRIDFDNISEARKFVDRNSGIKNLDIYGLTDYKYVYLFDNYRNQIYDLKKIKVSFFDIENEYEVGKPMDINAAEFPITAITYSVGDKLITFGLKDFIPPEKNIKYIKCSSEEELLSRFIKMWQHPDYAPDIISGWNIQNYDVPYLINRIIKLLSYEDACKLSPWGVLEERQIDYRGKKYDTYIPTGISVLDYMLLFLRYKEQKFESYSLENICMEELGVGKLDYSEYNGLMDLYERNPQLFFHYNCIDVQRCIELDKKNKFIELAVSLAYMYGVNYDDIFTTVKPWDIKIHNFLMQENIVIPPKKVNIKEEFIGGYVKDPKIGFNDWVVSFDLNSLYPHLIMTYNISPETYKGKLENKLKIDDFLNKVNFDNQGYSVACNNTKFDKSRLGFMPKLMNILYSDRKVYKKKLFEAEELYNETKDEKYQYDITRNHNFQLSLKIQINAFYGYLSNTYSRWYKTEFAEAITASGRVAIQWVTKDVNEFLNKKFNTENIDYSVIGDTDSFYVNVLKYLDGKDYLTSQEKAKLLYEFGVNEIQKIIQKSFEKFHEYTNSYENKLVMKIESISERIIVVAKKRYIMSIWSNEGIFYDKPKVKIKGLEVVKSSTPKICKEDIKKCIDMMLSTNFTEENVIDFVSGVRESFLSKYTLEEIAKPQGVGDVSGYTDDDGSSKKGAQTHFRAAINYNRLIDHYNLEGKYSKIYNKEKMKYLFLKKENPIGENVIGFVEEFPKEFGLEEFIDREEQFEKVFLSPLVIITTAIQWNLTKRISFDQGFEGLI